jgi:DNA-binding NarL/FixJ family response regulator
MNMDIKVMLVDDHTIIRNSLKIALDQEPGITVVGDTPDGRTALKLALENKPDVVLMDVNMPNLNGVESAKLIKNALPHTAVLGLSMHVHRNYVIGLLRAGASGYLPKTVSLDELVKAIHTVVKGKKYINAEISDILVGAVLDNDNAHQNDQSPLTPREREVVQLIAEGHTTLSIAEILCISDRTVESHRRQAMKKVHLKNTAGLVKYALREGLVSNDS